MPDGTVLKLSRDAVKATRPRWVNVGMWDGQCVSFITDTHDVAVAATHLFRNGWAVTGCTVHPFQFETTSRHTSRITHPESLMGDVKARSLDLGGTAKGEKGARTFGSRFSVDVDEMARRIAARKAK